MYQHAYNIKVTVKGFFDPGSFNTDVKLIKGKNKIKFNDQAIRREFYYAQKHLKAQDCVYDINEMIQKRFDLKRTRKKTGRFHL